MKFNDTDRGGNMFRGIDLQTRQIRNNQGRTKTYYRYGTSGPWYRSLASAQIAAQSR